MLVLVLLHHSGVLLSVPSLSSLSVEGKERERSDETYDCEQM